MKAPLNQVVGYVAAPRTAGGKTTIKKAVVLEAYDDGSARLDLTERNENGEAKNKDESLGHHTAIANYDESKQSENSWHINRETLASGAISQPTAANA